MNLETVDMSCDFFKIEYNRITPQISTFVNLITQMPIFFADNKKCT